jgi:hypothetical protein
MLVMVTAAAAAMKTYHTAMNSRVSALVALCNAEVHNT